MKSFSRICEFLDDFRCPICKEIMSEPYGTLCGHTFCHECIQTHLNNRQKCPCCSAFVVETSIHPVFALEKIVGKAAQLVAADTAPPVAQLSSLLASTSQLRTCTDVDELIKVLQARRSSMGQHQQEINLHLLLHFLHKAKSELLQQAEGVKARTQSVGQDIAAVKRKRDALKIPGLPPATPSAAAEATSSATAGERCADGQVAAASVPSALAASDQGPGSQDDGALVRDGAACSAQPQCVRLEPVQATAGSALVADGQLEALTRKLIAKKKRIVTQFDEFQALYLGMGAAAPANKALVPQEPATDPLTALELRHNADAGPSQSAASAQGADADTDVEQRLAKFGLVLSRATQYLELKKIGEMLPMKEPGGRVPTLSSIEFSSDQQLFALGFHSQTVKVYNYDAVLSAGSQLHRPLQEVTGHSKVSGVSWSHGTKEHLLHCGSPEGSIVLWSVATAQELRTFAHHTKRVWSVHFSPREHQLFVSGSDDASVKVWAANRAEPVMTLAMGYNVCCAQFSPDDGNVIAVGTAGHTVAVYDIRSTAHPLAMMQGHRKAVSYVKFLNGKQLMSCSIDNTLCLWDIPSASLVRTFSGHVNKKNFVGMSVSGDYIACGSEASQVHVFYKQVCRPILDYTFSMPHGSEATPCFTSAVTWKPNSTHLLAANSFGIVTILSMSQ